MSDLPDRAYMTPLLNRIADVAGERAAIILGREKACERIYIPYAAPADHWLSVLVGLEAAQAICDEFGGDKLEIPPAMAGNKRRLAATIAEMIDKGYSNNAIARALGITHKTVQRHRGKGDERQGSLF